jgi:hypothetical protein
VFGSGQCISNKSFRRTTGPQIQHLRYLIALGTLHSLYLIVSTAFSGFCAIDRRGFLDEYAHLTGPCLTLENLVRNVLIKNPFLAPY